MATKDFTTEGCLKPVNKKSIVGDCVDHLTKQSKMQVKHILVSNNVPDWFFSNIIITVK